MATPAPKPPTLPKIVGPPIFCIGIGILQSLRPDILLFPGVPGGAYIMPGTLMGTSLISLRVLTQIKGMKENVGQSYARYLKPLHLANVAAQLFAIYRIAQAPERLPPWSPEPHEVRKRRIERALELAQKYPAEDQPPRIEENEEESK